MNRDRVSNTEKGVLRPLWQETKKMKQRVSYTERVSSDHFDRNDRKRVTCTILRLLWQKNQKNEPEGVLHPKGVLRQFGTQDTLLVQDTLWFIFLLFRCKTPSGSFFFGFPVKASFFFGFPVKVVSRHSFGASHPLVYFFLGFLSKWS